MSSAQPSEHSTVSGRRRTWTEMDGGDDYSTLWSRYDNPSEGRTPNASLSKYGLVDIRREPVRHTDHQHRQGGLTHTVALGAGLQGGAGGELQGPCAVHPDAAQPHAASMQLDEQEQLLAEEQRSVLELVLRGHSLFFTGAAGTGKSFLLKAIQQAFAKRDMAHNVFMTGTTGKASCNIGGSTIHSFAGIGMGNMSIEQMLSKVNGSRGARQRWRACKVLVIDEVSMLDADLFDKINIVGSRIRNDFRPFGGVQLVLCGDFFQLPPVGIDKAGVKFCFEAKCWDLAVSKSIVLKQVFRQKDQQFLSILHELREGRLGPEARRVLDDKVRESQVAVAQEQRKQEQALPGPDAKQGAAAAAGDEPVYTLLYSRNDDVDRINQDHLQRIQAPAVTFTAEDWGEQGALRQLQQHCAGLEELQLKVGAHVILLKNLDVDRDLVNGATGVVEEISTTSGAAWPRVRFTNGDNASHTILVKPEKWSINQGDRELATRTQIPLRLAWALSVHKAQGMTITHVTISTRGIFEYGQAYVALSRATSLAGLRLLDFNPKVVKAHRRVMDFYRRLEAQHAAPPWPPGPGPTATGWFTRQPGASLPAHPPTASYPLASPSAAARTGGSATRTPLSSPPSAACVIAPATGSGLTQEQRERMEENRRKALVRLQANRVGPKPTG